MPDPALPAHAGSGPRNTLASEIALVRAHSLVSELQSALRPEHDDGLASELNAFYDALVPGGYLVLGRVETLLGRPRTLFRPISTRERIYRKPT